jgi:hypothetical protein
MAVSKHELRVDISGQTEVPGPLSVALSVFTPEPDELADPPVVLFAYPGAGYTRGYYDIELPGLDGYSQARYHAGRGWIVVAADHLGVGDSSLAEDPQAADFAALTLEAHGAANDAAARLAAARLADGTLIDGFPAVPGATVLGIGHSMGGILLTQQQGGHATFDGVGFLGWGASGSALAMPPDAEPLPPVGENDDLSAYLEIIARLIAWNFFRDDVPAVVLAAERGYPAQRDPLGPWATPNIPLSPEVSGALLSAASGGPVMRMLPDLVARIDVPVLVAAADRDVVVDLEAESKAYPGSPDVQSFVLPGSAHMHNFAGTRAQLWDRIHAWGSGVAGQAVTQGRADSHGGQQA